MLHARIAARAFNTPLLVEPSKAMAFLSGLGPRVIGRRVETAGMDGEPEGSTTLPTRASIIAGNLTESLRQHGDAPYPVIDGIAVIEISGVLIHRGGWIGESSGQTSYEGIAAQIEAAASDPSVRGVALEIDSFGGEVAGVFDLADRIRALRRDKPVWAFVAEHAFSAGYALASQASRRCGKQSSMRWSSSPRSSSARRSPSGSSTSCWGWSRHFMMGWAGYDEKGGKRTFSASAKCFGSEGES